MSGIGHARLNCCMPRFSTVGHLAASPHSQRSLSSDHWQIYTAQEGKQAALKVVLHVGSKEQRENMAQGRKRRAFCARTLRRTQATVAETNDDRNRRNVSKLSLRQQTLQISRSAIQVSGVLRPENSMNLSIVTVLA